MLKRKFPCSPFKRRDCMETIKILTPTIELITNISVHLFIRITAETTSHLISTCHNTAPPLPDSSQHLQEVHTLYKILFPDAWNLLTLLRQRYLLINEPLQSVIH